MKQALTAKGGLDVWMRSSELALENMGVEQVNVDEASQQITGMHPEKGPIAIDYMIPDQGKTRMIITVDDATLIDDYKRAVAPVFRSVVAEMQKAEEEAVREAEEQKAAQTESTEEEQPVDEAAQTADEAPADYDGEAAYEKPEKRTEITESPEPPKKKSKAPIVILIIVIIAAVLAAGYFLWYRPNHQSTANTTQSTTDTDSSDSSSDTASDSSSDNSAADTSSADSNATTNNSNDNNTSSNTAAATLAAYNQVTADATSGMTYDQVKALFNNQDGQQLSDSTYQDESGNQIHTQVYYWTGNGSSGSNATVTFSNGVATQKSQYDLK